MTEITDDQKYGMIEAIAHLLNRDYSEIGQDFVNLDFIPKGIDTAPIVPALTKVFDAALAGGGAKSINFQELAGDLAEITFEYPFRIPPYFALVIRAIGVLEGIALVGNPNFAIIDEAYPYIARRLMTDNSPRLKAALRYMVYGREGSFDAEKLIDLLQALEKFTAVRDEGDGSAFKVDGVRGSKNVGTAGDFSGSKQVDASGSNGANTNLQATTSSERDKKTVREALRFFFSPEGNVFREFLLEETVNFVDAAGREATQELMMNLGLSNLPMPSLLRAMNPNLSPEDKQVSLRPAYFFCVVTNCLTYDYVAFLLQMVQQMRKLSQFLVGDFDGALSSQRLRGVLPVVREYAPQLREFTSLLAIRLTEKGVSRGLNWASARLATR
jgi:aarF domain-containing kinase